MKEEKARVLNQLKTPWSKKPYMDYTLKELKMQISM